MEHRTNPIAKAFALLFVILFVISGFAALIIFNFVNQAFDPALYKNALSDSGIYGDLPKLIGEQIVYQSEHNACLQDPTVCPEGESSPMPAYFKDIDSSEWRAVLGKLIDPVWFQTQVESAIDQVIGFISNPGQPLSINLSLMELKTRLGGEEGYQASLLMLQSLEPCSIVDIMKLPYQAGDSGGLFSLELCNPGETATQLREEILRAALKSVSETIPENTSTYFEPISVRLSANLESSLRTLQLVKTISTFSPVIPLFFLLVVTLLVVRNLKGFLTWWGIPITIIGILVFLSALFITPAMRSTLIRLNMQGLAPGMVDWVKTVVLNVARSFEYTLLVQAVILFIVGIIMILVSIILKKKPVPVPAE
jgi:hypothetical protein